jgi:queuine tRNA-ribosyltransferase
MCFDECTPFPATHAQAAESMRLSMRWAARCRAAFVPREGYGLFGIVQGSTFDDLRAESVAALAATGFEGYAIGGLAVGEGQAEMFRVLDVTVPLLPSDAPRYLMGVGTPGDLVGAVRRGVDMFDCVMPTRSGRTGRAYTSRGVLNLRNARHADDAAPLDPDCECPACTRHSRAYLHHLVKAEEMLGPMLLTWHNIRYYQSVMERLRRAVLEGRFEAEAAAIEAGWAAGEAERKAA